MKLDIAFPPPVNFLINNHYFNSSQQNEDITEIATNTLSNDSLKESKGSILFDTNEKTFDPSQNEVEHHDGFWQILEFDSFSGVNTNTAESNTMEVKDYESLNCHENSGQIKENMHLLPEKSNGELEEPELVICYRESSYVHIKDICVDENMPSYKRILSETDLGKDHLHSLLPSEKDKSNHLTTETTEVGTPTLDYSNLCQGQNGESPDSQVSLENMTQTEVKVHDVAEYVPVAVSLMLLKDHESATKIFQQEPSSEDTCNENTQMPTKEPVMEAITTRPAQTPADEESASISHAEESNDDSLTDLEHEISASPFGESNYDVSLRGSCNGNGRVDSSDSGNQENQVQNQNIPKICDSRTSSFRDQHGHGETSFSMAGPVSGLITYSGPIACSGSLSRRSDSSTTSTRSFAFPVLQSEWNSSPVRMAKADRRRFGKHRGWRQGLLCCRF